MFPQKIFAERLKQLRINRKITMQKLAKERIKNKGTIGQFETEITVTLLRYTYKPCRLF